MNVQHKHAIILRAIADGNVVEYRHNTAPLTGNWTLLVHLGTLEHSDYEFRVRPHKWQKEIDAQKAGKEVQWRWCGFPDWNDNYCGNNGNFDGEGHEYRVKPDSMRYRVARMLGKDGEYYTTTADRPANEVGIAGMLDFIEWLGDWQEVEVSR